MYTITYMYIAMHCTYWSNWPTHHSKTLLLHLMKYCVIGKDSVVQSTSMRDMGLDELISSTDRWTINQQDALLLTGLHPTLTLPHPFHIAKSTHSWPACLIICRLQPGDAMTQIISIEDFYNQRKAPSVLMMELCRELRESKSVVGNLISNHH